MIEAAYNQPSPPNGSGLAEFWGRAELSAKQTKRKFLKRRSKLLTLAKTLVKRSAVLVWLNW